MSAKAPKSLKEVLAGGRLAALGDEARRRRGLTEEIRALLPPDSAAHLVTASRDTSDTLVLTMDASVWAARVRFLADQLGVARVKVRVAPIGEEWDRP